MLTYIDNQCGRLIVAASGLTTAFSGQITEAITAFALEQYRYEERANETIAHGTDRCAIANELVLSFSKTQGSANEIQVQITESDTEDFTLSNVISVRGKSWLTIKSDTYDDSTLYRVEPIAIRGKYVKIAARYSGGAAASAALNVYAKFFHNEQMYQGSTAIVGAGGLAADVRSIDRVADEGLAYSAAITVSAGSWAGGTVTMTCTGHAWIAGDIITVSGCGNANYNGTHTITAVATNTFDATLADPGAFTTNGSAIQAQSTTRLVDERKSWTANQWYTLGAYVEITSGTGARQYKAVTSNGTHWLAFAAMTTAPVTSDSSYSIIETGVKALVCDTELNLSVGSITVSNIDAYKYIAAPPDLAGGESAQGRCDIKGNLQVVGPEAHGAAIARNPVLVSGYASSTLPTAVDAADVCRMWTSLNGSVVVSGYNEDPATPVTALLPIGTDNVACSQAAPQLVRTGGEARASGGALTEGDSALFSTDLYGGLRVAGGSPHGAAAVQNPVLVGGFCTASIPTALDENDAGHSWHNLNGIQIVGGLLEDGALNYGVGLPIGRDNAVGTDTTPDLVKVGGQARAGGAAYLEGDSVVESFDLVGGLRVAGSVAHGVAATGNPLLCGAYASDVIQAATTAGYASRLWASLNGALCIAGLYQHATPASAIAKTIPVVVDDAIMFTGATAFPVAGQYNATALTYTDKDATVLQTNVSGALITTGGVGGGTPYYGRKTIATPGTEEALHAGQAILNGFAVSVKALQTNTNPVYVGANGLTSATGYPLYPGEEISLAVTNLNLIYLDVTTAGEGVAFIVES